MLFFLALFLLFRVIAENFWYDLRIRHESNTKLKGYD